jgi:hypothetical protein
MLCFLSDHIYIRTSLKVPIIRIQEDLPGGNRVDVCGYAAKRMDGQTG